MNDDDNTHTHRILYRIEQIVSLAWDGGNKIIKFSFEIKLSCGVNA